jgi:hypothetical protein
MYSRQRVRGASGLGRFARGRRIDRNPLRRASDVMETVVLALLVVGFAVGAPLLAQAVGARTYAHAHSEEVSQRASRYEVSVIPLVLPASGSGGTYQDTDEPARWTAPDGTVRTGQVLVPAGTRRGAAVPAWTTRQGMITDPPLQSSQVIAQADFAAVFSVLCLGVLLGGAGVATRSVLNRRRMREWGTEWQAVGPRWTART